MNYSSFLDFTRIYERTSGIFVHCLKNIAPKVAFEMSGYYPGSHIIFSRLRSRVVMDHSDKIEQKKNIFGLIIHFMYFTCHYSMDKQSSIESICGTWPTWV